MPFDTLKTIIEKSAPYTLLWAFWWIIAQLNWVRKGEKFRWTMLAVNIIVSAWVGVIVGTSLPETMGDTRFAITSVAWVLSFPLIDIIEKRGLDLLINRILWKK